jgi:hypothetical protein
MVEPAKTTDNSIKRRMRVARLITKATDTNSEHAILIFFHRNSSYANGSQYKAIRSLPVLFAMSRPDLASTKRSIPLLLVTDSPEEGAGGGKRPSHFHLVQMSIIRGAIPPLPHMPA